MLIDGQQLFADDQELFTSGPLSNIIDLATARRVGTGEQLTAVCVEFRGDFRVARLKRIGKRRVSSGRLPILGL